MQISRILNSVWRSAALPGALALLAVFAMQLAGVQGLKETGYRFFDALVRAEPRTYQPVPVRIVDIDEESLRRQGQWPWPRTDVARLMRQLSDAGAAAIALDIVFSEPDRTSPPRIADSMARTNGDLRVIAALRDLPDNDAQLASAMSQMPVVTGYFLTRDGMRQRAEPKAGIAVSGTPPGTALPNYSNAILSLPPIERAAAGSGFLSIAGDSDGIIRKAPLLAMQDGQILPSCPSSEHLAQFAA